MFLPKALGVVCEKRGKLPGPYVSVVVEDSFEALKRIGEFYRQQLPVKVVNYRKRRKISTEKNSLQPCSP